MHIRNRVLQRVARIELEHDPVERLRLGHFIVIGGGFSGVEVAGSIADFLRGASRYYPRVRPGELKVTVLHDAPRLLPELPESLGQAAARSLQSRRIGVRLDARAVRADADGVALAGGEFIAGSTVICTVGAKPNPLAEAIGVPRQRGRIETRADMSAPGMAKVWALGDCALVSNAATGQPAPPTAQFAVAQARALARNIVSTIEGRATEPFSHASRGMMATTGHLKGVARIGRLRLAGLPAWLLWRAYYLLQMPTFGRKVRIFVEWTWSMFFAADITHLRFTRTDEADTPERTSPFTVARPAP
jgi:NADH dehydrogenase